MSEPAWQDVDGWLAAVLMERRPAWPFAPDAGVDAVLDAARAGGVTALLQARLQSAQWPVPDALRQALAARARALTAQSLHQQAQARGVLARLAEAGVPVLLLKGSALSQWAYGAPHWRECSDVDLLLPDVGAAQEAVARLAQLGYAANRAMSAADLVNFEVCCVRAAGNDPLEVDVHWRLSNTPLFAFRFAWQELWDGSIALPALGQHARGLAPLPAFLHACMHRVQSLVLGDADRLKWLLDLVVLGHGFTSLDWQALAREARQRGLAGVCLDSLRAAESRLGRFVPGSCIKALTEAAREEPLQVERLQNWWYFQRRSWQAFPLRRQRWRWLRQRLLPNATYLRERHGSRGGLPGAMWRRMRAGLQRLRS